MSEVKPEATGSSGAFGWLVSILIGALLFAWFVWPSGDQQPQTKARILDDGGAQLKVESLPPQPMPELRWEEDKPNAEEKQAGWTHVYYLTTDIDKAPVTMWVFVGDNKDARKVRVNVTRGEEYWRAFDDGKKFHSSAVNVDCSLKDIFTRERKRPGLPPAISGQLDKLTCGLINPPPYSPSG